MIIAAIVRALYTNEIVDAGQAILINGMAGLASAALIGQTAYLQLVNMRTPFKHKKLA